MSNISLSFEQEQILEVMKIENNPVISIPAGSGKKVITCFYFEYLKSLIPDIYSSMKIAILCDPREVDYWTSILEKFDISYKHGITTFVPDKIKFRVFILPDWREEMNYDVVIYDNYHPFRYLNITGDKTIRFVSDHNKNELYFDHSDRIPCSVFCQPSDEAKTKMTEFKDRIGGTICLQRHENFFDELLDNEDSIILENWVRKDHLFEQISGPVNLSTIRLNW